MWIETRFISLLPSMITFIQPKSWMWIETMGLFLIVSIFHSAKAGCGLKPKQLGKRYVLILPFIQLKLGVDWNFSWVLSFAVSSRLSSSLIAGCGLKQIANPNIPGLMAAFIQLTSWMWIETLATLWRVSDILTFIQLNSWMWIETTLQIILPLNIWENIGYNKLWLTL